MKNATDPCDGKGDTGSPCPPGMGSNVRRNIGNPALAVCGVCLVVLIALVVFKVSGGISLLLAVAMLWVLGQIDRPARSKSTFQRALDADAKADDEFREQMALLAARERNEEEAPWKSDS